MSALRDQITKLRAITRHVGKLSGLELTEALIAALEDIDRRLTKIEKSGRLKQSSTDDA